MTWHPIETAPPDMWVLIATTGDWVGEACQDDGVWKWANGVPIHPNHVPTHWMPLPEPPR